MKISVLVPVYNESPIISLVLERVREAPLPGGCEKEILVIDDGSTDGTRETLACYAGSPPFVVHHCEKNRGKGAALRIGIAKAEGDIVLVQDGDLEYDPRDYLQILQPILSGEADVVYGSRFLGSVRGMKWANRLANRVLTFAANLLFAAEITDEATAYKAFRRTVLDEMELNCTRFDFCPEVTAKVRRLGYRIHEVPVSYNPRGILEGKKIRWTDGLQALWMLCKYRVARLGSFAKRPATRAKGAPVRGKEGTAAQGLRGRRGGAAG